MQFTDNTLLSMW